MKATKRAGPAKSGLAQLRATLRERRISLRKQEATAKRAAEKARKRGAAQASGALRDYRLVLRANEALCRAATALGVALESLESAKLSTHIARDLYERTVEKASGMTLHVQRARTFALDLAGHDRVQRAAAHEFASNA